MLNEWCLYDVHAHYKLFVYKNKFSYKTTILFIKKNYTQYIFI